MSLLAIVLCLGACGLGFLLFFPRYVTLVVVLCGLLPGLMLSAAVMSIPAPGAKAPDGVDSPIGSWRVELEAVELSLVPGKADTIGGDAEEDSVVVPHMPESFLRLEALPDNQGLAVSTRDTHAPPFGMVVQATTKTDPRGVRLPPGTILCLAGKDGGCAPNSRGVQLGKDGQTLFSLDGTTPLCEIPFRRLRLDHVLAHLGFVERQLGPEQRVYPLSTFGREQCTSPKYFTWSEALPAAGFFYRMPGRGPLQSASALYFKALDDSTPLMMQVPGEPAKRLEARSWQVGPGQELGLDFYRLRLAEGVERQVVDDQGNKQVNLDVPLGSRLSKIRTLRLVPLPASGNDHVTRVRIVLNTPESHDLPAQIKSLSVVTAHGIIPHAVDADAEVLGFDALGAEFDRLQDNVRWMQSACAARESCNTLLVSRPSGVTRARLGEHFMLGDEQKVQLRVTPIEVPYRLFAILALWGVMGGVVRRFLPLAPAAAAALVLGDVLLTLRALAAFEAGVMDHTRSPDISGAIPAFLLLPALAEVLVSVLARSPVWRGGAGLRVVFALLLSWLLVDSPWHFAGDVPQRSADGSVAAKTLVSVLVLAGIGVAAWISGWLGRAPSRPALGHDKLKFSLRFVLWVAAIHLLLGVLGFKEQLFVVRVASVVIPLLLIAFAHYYEALQERPDMSGSSLWRRAGVVLEPLLPLAAYVPFVAAVDLGAYVYFLGIYLAFMRLALPADTRLRDALYPVFVAIAAVLLGIVLAHVYNEGIGHLSFALIAISCAGSILLILVCGVLRLRPTPASRHMSWLVPPALALGLIVGLHLDVPKSGAEMTLSEIVAITGNQTRLLHLANAGTVESFGTREGNQTVTALRHMQAYASPERGQGRGWLGGEPPTELRDTHVNDTVTAVHLMSPFGRGAAVGMMLLFCMLSFLVLESPGSGWLRQTANFAAVTLSAVSLYILLDNIGVVPFTGRNFYWLSVESGSDLVEGGILFGLILAGVQTPVRSSA